MRDELFSEDWDIVKQFLPADWEVSARQCGALRRCRNVDSADLLLRLILLHVAGGLSLRQTAVRAQALGWATLSDVALLKRLRSSAGWLEYLCANLWQDWTWPEGLSVQRRRWRLVDATTVQEPGATGITWRVHYAVRLPLPACDFVAVTSVRGGETLCRVPIRPDDVILADRGYSHRSGVDWVLSQGGQVLLRHQGANFPLEDRRGVTFELLPALRRLSEHRPGSWSVAFQEAGRRWSVWLHAVRKSTLAAERAKAELRRERGDSLQPETLELAEYVVVLCSFSPSELPALSALSLYRGRWQIELAFKRLKSLLVVGDLAKYDPDSARAWLQAKLLTALLIERLEREARLFSPWGFPMLVAVGMEGVSGDAGQPAPGGGASAAVETTLGPRTPDRTAASGTDASAETADGWIS